MNTYANLPTPDGALRGMTIECPDLDPDEDHKQEFLKKLEEQDNKKRHELAGAAYLATIGEYHFPLMSEEDNLAHANKILKEYEKYIVSMCKNCTDCRHCEGSDALICGKTPCDFGGEYTKLRRQLIVIDRKLTDRRGDLVNTYSDAHVEELFEKYKAAKLASEKCRKEVETLATEREKLSRAMEKIKAD